MAMPERICRSVPVPSSRINLSSLSGLDYYWPENPPRELQKRVFRAQMALARELNLPVIVHDREAHGDSMDVVREFPEVGRRSGRGCRTGRSAQLGPGGNGVVHHQQVEDLLPLLGVDGGDEHPLALPAHHLPGGQVDDGHQGLRPGTAPPNGARCKAVCPCPRGRTCSQVWASALAPIWAKIFSQLPGMKGVSSTVHTRTASSRL